MFCLSRRYSTLPALTSLTALVTSIVTVPLLGFGIKPFGPRILAQRPSAPIISGVVMQTSKSSHEPDIIFAIISSSPTISAPAFLASSALSPFAMTNTRTVLPVPSGSTTTPRTCWSALRPSTPSLMCNSTVSSNFALLALTTASKALFASYVLVLSISFRLST